MRYSAQNVSSALKVAMAMAHGYSVDSPRHGLCRVPSASDSICKEPPNDVEQYENVAVLHDCIAQCYAGATVVQFKRSLRSSPSAFTGTCNDQQGDFEFLTMQ